MGKFIGTIITIASPGLFRRLAIQPEEVLTLNVLIYMITYLILIVGLRNVRVRQVTQHHGRQGLSTRADTDPQGGRTQDRD